ncbi:glutamine amidotransferase, putative [Candida dubliniensis CD36]|uniref:Glutamine amidotransferase, putative n=1 Tax=Candida dubliniensis (strain CD36 / ATCC MYA-646 / CBS 7987 / NCPF 3949 / NRRL Y-17841) TaxID=573826 RepID=B9WBL4_CANDC|nr:glutamine amidotransferase, putative [Candida dubliniensis CD36]CAX43785.1 glutamine amidotransferase, putative [Candida dubliniensis CD36]
MSSSSPPTTTTTTKHIAILVLQSYIPNVTDKHGDFGDNIIDLLNRAQINYPMIKYQLCTDDEAQLSQAYQQLNHNLSANLITGVVLSGSKSDAFDNSKLWINKLDEFIVETLFKLSTKLPIVGICFGHQILAKNLGCKIGRNELGWEAGTHTIELNQEIFKIENTPFLPALLSPKDNSNNNNDDNPENQVLLDHLNLVESHQDIIHGLPTITGFEDMVSIGSTVKCNIQGMITTKTCPIRLLTFQGHPEFTTPIELDILKNSFEHGVFNEQEYEKFKYQTNSLNNQGDLIGKVIAKFLLT